jgi:hypothetical protein
MRGCRASGGERWRNVDDVQVGARNYFTTEIILDLWLLCRRCECQRLQRLQAAVECMMKSFFETSKPFVAVVSSKTGACGQSLL